MKARKDMKAEGSAEALKWERKLKNDTSALQFYFDAVPQLPGYFVDR